MFANEQSAGAIEPGGETTDARGGGVPGWEERVDAGVGASAARGRDALGPAEVHGHETTAGGGSGDNDRIGGRVSRLAGEQPLAYGSGLLPGEVPAENCYENVRNLTDTTKALENNDGPPSIAPGASAAFASNPHSHPRWKLLEPKLPEINPRHAFHLFSFCWTKAKVINDNAGIWLNEFDGIKQVAQTIKMIAACGSNNGQMRHGLNHSYCRLMVQIEFRLQSNTSLFIHNQTR